MKKAKMMKKLLFSLVLLAFFGVYSTQAQVTETETNLKGEFEVDGKQYGLPKAELFEEDYTGPPVVGEYVTLLPNVAKLPEGNRVHEVRMDILAQRIEVGPGVRYDAWTFGGTVPGPVLHVREGDKVIFTMKNRTGEAVNVSEPMNGNSPFLQQLSAGNVQNPSGVQAPMVHSMDFHSGTVAADDKWRNVPPGMSVKFEWIANYPGVYLYHCGTPPVLQHMSMGQYGMVIVSPKEGYPTDDEVDKEFAVVQSEFYLQEIPASDRETIYEPGEDVSDMHELDFVAAMEKRPNIVAFNGHQFRLMNNPLHVNVGDRVRLYLLNAGPNDVASHHVIGAIFDRVWFEGSLENEWRGMQTVLLGASNGAVVEFIVPEEGHYVLVDHEMADAMKGAQGLMIAAPKGEETGPDAQENH